MKKPKIRELKEALASLISRPYTQRFPYVPHIPARRFRGLPEFNQAKCIGCTACAQVCPADAIEVTDTKEGTTGIRKLTHQADKCLFCGQCELNCPIKDGIKLSQKFDLAYFKPEEVQHSVEQELLICAACGNIIGTKKHIQWLVKKLGNLAFSQALMLSAIEEKLEIISEYEEKFNPPIQRTDTLKIVCPRCRRIAFLSDEKMEK